MVVKYAGFWRRFLAHIIDAAILFIPMIIIDSAFDQFGFIFNIILIWQYYAFQESSSYQATLGKRALGLKVTDMKGKRISYGRATGRYYASFISALILCIGYVMIAFTKKKQALHDKIAETLVVR